jgi:hypothetical protein
MIVLLFVLVRMTVAVLDFLVLARSNRYGDDRPPVSKKVFW